MRGMLKLFLNVVFVLILITVLFSYAMFQGGFVSWFLFYSFLPIIIYQLGLLFYPIRNWKVTRGMSRRVLEAGDGVTVTINIDRKIRYPIYYCIVEEVFPETLSKIDSKQEKYHYMDSPNKLMLPRHIKKIVFPFFKKNIRLDYTIAQVPRGEHGLKEIRIRVGDIFGFVKKEHVFATHDQLTAHPTELPLRLYEKNRNFDQGTVSTSPMKLTNTNIAVGVREYAPGDKFSWIDWKQTAKKNTVMTKEFEQEKSTNVLLVLNRSNYPGLNPLAFEATVEVTLSLMATLRKQQTEINLLTIGGDTGTMYFPIYQDIAIYNMAKKHLTQLVPSDGTHSFSIELKEQMMRLNHGDTMIIVTTNLDKHFKQTIQQLNKRIKNLGIIFIQSMSFISGEEKDTMNAFRFSGISVDVLTEEQLVKNPIEVSLR